MNGTDDGEPWQWLINDALLRGDEKAAFALQAFKGQWRSAMDNAAWQKRARLAAGRATGTEARVCADIADRQALGVRKYGTTVEDNPLPLLAWLRHAYEESLDLPIYLKRAIEQLGAATFQQRVGDWLLACLGEAIALNTVERNHRFLEEALELVQALGCTQSEAHQLVDYVFGRPVGDPRQETGGVMVTLAALCGTAGIDLDAAAEAELARVWGKMEEIRAKQAAKPRHSPLPGAAP